MSVASASLVNFITDTKYTTTTTKTIKHGQSKIIWKRTIRDYRNRKIVIFFLERRLLLSLEVLNDNWNHPGTGVSVRVERIA